MLVLVRLLGSRETILRCSEELIAQIWMRKNGYRYVTHAVNRREGRLTYWVKEREDGEPE